MFHFPIRFKLGFIPLLLIWVLAHCGASASREDGPGRCCVMADQTVAGVELEKICLKGGTSQFHFSMTVQQEACVDLTRTELKDSAGRVYRGLSHRGLPDCAEELPPMQQPTSFTWTFEEFDDDATGLSLVENYTREVPAWKMQWNSWKWPSLDLAHCKF